MKEIHFNINDNIKVKLTQLGEMRHLESYNKNLPAKHHKTIADIRSRIDIDGYYTFQMWDFMSHFGGSMSMGMLNLFNGNILIQVR